MLDTIFYYMAIDQFSEWNIHCRLVSDGGNVESLIPHHFTDGRGLVRTLLPSLMNLCQFSKKLWRKEYDQHDIIPIKSGSLTRFQTMLPIIIEQLDLTLESQIAMAVDISQVHSLNKENQGNQIACPIFNCKDLLELASSDKKTWSDVLQKKAVEEFKNYQSVASYLPNLPTDKRIELYHKFPFNSVDIVVSYFGNLDRIISHPEIDLFAFDFGPFSSRGPKKTLLGYSVDSETCFRLSETGRPFSWDDGLFRFSTK